MSNKTITIQQGTGDDALEMTVQVTQEELDKMEEIRSKDPSAWEGRGLDLVKAAKDAIIEASEEKAQPQKCTNWKLILGIALGVLVIIGTIIFAEKSRNREQEVSQKQEINNTGAIEQWIGSECVEVNRRRIYEALKEKNNSAVPESFNVFSKAMDNQSYRVWAYEEALQQKLKIGTKETFELAMTQPNSDIFRCIFEIASYYGMPDSEEDMVSYLKESEENRKKFYYKLLEVGMPDGFDEFSTLINHSYSSHQQPIELNTVDNTTDVFQPTIYNEDHLRLIYDTLVHRGYEGTYVDFYTYFSQSESNRIRVYEKLAETGSKGSYEQFLEFCYNLTPSKFVPEICSISFSENFTKIYLKAVEQFGLTDSEEQFYQYFIKNPQKVYEKFKKESDLTSSFEQFIEYSGIPYEAFSQQLQIPKKEMDLIRHKTFFSESYEFTYQYDDNEFKLVVKTNKNSHCVMKLQSPNDEIKSILVSVWDNSEFSSSFDSDFISSCQSVDEGMGKVISSAVKTKVDGVNALKSELIISPMGKSYYAAIYRIIHKKRMYMLNIYIPMEEYNKDKSYGDKCVNNFKFN